MSALKCELEKYQTQVDKLSKEKKQLQQKLDGYMAFDPGKINAEKCHNYALRQHHCDWSLCIAYLCFSLCVWTNHIAQEWSLEFFMCD